MKTEYKVEWVDESGRGHWAEFDSEETAVRFLQVLPEIAMMANMYTREVGEWVRK